MDLCPFPITPIILECGCNACTCGALFTSPINFEVGVWYEMRFRFIALSDDIPLDQAKNIIFGFSIKLRSLNPDYKVEGRSSSSGWTGVGDTGFFEGWSVGEWKSCRTSASCKFEVVKI